MNDPWTWVLNRSAERDLKRCTDTDRRRVIDKLDELVRDPLASQLDVDRIRGHSGLLRLRVGELRVIYRLVVETRCIQVILIAPRGDVYKLLGRRDS